MKNSILWTPIFFREAQVKSKRPTLNLNAAFGKAQGQWKIQYSELPFFFREAQVKWKAATLNLNAAFGKAQRQWKIQYSELPIFFRRPK